MSKASLRIGPLLPGETSYVLSSWKKSHRDAPQNDGVPAGAYYDRMNRHVDETLEREGVRVFVARDSEHGVILGWVCVEDLGDTMQLHYVYVRGGAHRRRGVCTALIGHALKELPKAELLAYTTRSRFDSVWESWGFEATGGAR